MGDCPRTEQTSILGLLSSILVGLVLEFLSRQQAEKYQGHPSFVLLEKNLFFFLEKFLIDVGSNSRRGDSQPTANI
jgi:hypothetical protein